ncbi:hypothetical protein MBRA1_003528 [Malassezia brasiliensis]|uniref:Uncharacterized protein n=1 Tax=Malassezia brasiliensis TaxID=1821822 RepID=A0AAF0E0G8_9BASI|nr:hypothetical protein MBRA1_003528 [Malassezia brasiliensis]
MRKNFAQLRTDAALVSAEELDWFEVERMIAILLREAENTRQFLTAWHETGRYTIYSLDDDVLNPSLRSQYAFWLAHRA